MSKAHIAQSALEISLALLLIWACIHADKLADWEARQRDRFRRWQHKVRRALVAAGDVLWGEPCLINARGEKEPLRVLRVKEQEDYREQSS